MVRRQDGPRHVGTNDCLTTPCKTIQHAVERRPGPGCPGDNGERRAGIYPEQVTIATSLTLIGAGAASTTIQAPTTLAGPLDIVTIGQARSSS